jgi:hypothetical protein
VTGRAEPALEQRLDALETAVQRLTDALGAVQPAAAPAEAAPAATPEAVPEVLPDALPAALDWPGRCRQLIDRHVPAGEPVAVVADPAVLPFEALGRPVVEVAPDPAGSAAAVAALQAQRTKGVRFLFVAAPGQWALEQDSLLTEHLRAHFRAIGAEPDVGLVFVVSLQRAADAEPPALGVVIDDLGLDDRLEPLLDWTTLELARLLPGRTVFRPVEPDARQLPYADHTIEVVLADDPERMDEAARIASCAVVLVADDGAGGAIVLETRRLRSDRGPDPAPILILVATDADDEWLACLAEAVAERPGVEVRAAADAIAAAAETDVPTVVVAERGILPLPGCIEAAERLLAHDQKLGGVAVKLFRADGSLEAAGGAAFADGSVEGIAGGAAAAAPWHEFVRPVDAAVGLIVLRSAAVRQSAAAEDAGAFDLTSLSARLLSGGWGLRYQPDSAAVRVLARAAAQAAVWPRADGRPPRPAELGDGAWRRLLAGDQVGAAR